VSTAVSLKQYYCSQREVERLRVEAAKWIKISTPGAAFDPEQDLKVSFTVIANKYSDDGLLCTRQSHSPFVSGS